MTHIIKLMEQFCDAVLDGDKCFEIRNNDRGYQKGDRVRFVSVKALGRQIHHEIDNREYEITYVLSGWGLQDGCVAFGIKEVNNGMDKS